MRVFLSTQMGAGRKTQTVNVDSSNPAYWNGSLRARGLHKNDLGGVIFGCKNNTMPECLSKQLFGLPPAHFCYVRNIGPGLPIFLFNYSDRKLHGIYESVSYGQMNIDAYAWTNGGADKTPFPAQVRICIRAQCQPLLETKFKEIIKDNYEGHIFWFELDHAQARRLVTLFKQLTPSPMPLPSPVSRTNHFPSLPSSKWNSKKDLEDTSSGIQNKFADNVDTDFSSSRRALSNAFEGTSSKEPISNCIDSKEPISNWANLFKMI